MPPLSAVKASNASYAPLYVPTAVFVGGTGGIGQAMAELLAKQTRGRANIIIIGRNKAAGERIIAGFPAPSGEDGVSIKHEFIQCDVSELQNVHEISQKLLKRLDKINFLVLTTSTNYSLSPVWTSEGLELMMVLRYYARVKFTHELMPLLVKAKDHGEDAKVMSVLAAAMGFNVDLDDLGLKKNWTMVRTIQLGPYTDIMVKVQSELHPDMAFIHIYPGTVDNASTNFHWTIRLLRPFFKHFIWSAEDSAENMMYPLLSPEFSKGGYWLGRRADRKTLGEEVNDEITRKVWEHTVEAAQLH